MDEMQNREKMGQKRYKRRKMWDQKSQNKSHGWKTQDWKMTVGVDDEIKVKLKEGHTPKERRRGVHFPFVGR